MKLRELLKGRGQTRIKEYEWYGDQLIFVGGGFYDGRRILPLDGKAYPMEMSVNAYEWEDGETLMIAR